MSLFLVLEGTDCAGKTTAGKQLARELDFEYIRTPGEEYASLRTTVDKLDSPDAKLLFYLSSVAHASRKVTTALQAGRNIICDRYVWSSLISHAAYYDKDLEQLEQTWTHLMQNLSKPTETILFTVSEEEQLHRLGEKRGEPYSASDQFCLQEKPRKKVRELYEQVARRKEWVIIDTTHTTIDRVVEELAALFLVH